MVGQLDPTGTGRGGTVRAVPVAGPGLLFGGDYNPEQWPEDVWVEDVALMRQAGVNLVTVGVFSWARLEPAPGEFDFGWLDRVLSLLHSHGIAVDLATPSASPPPWFSAAHQESLPVDASGHRLGWGARESFCPSSPVYREATARVADQLAARYTDHPAVVMWHVSNELGAHVAGCHCPVSTAAFRRWLRDRYGDIEKLNEAWGTAFWSQHYRDFDEITTPVRAPMPGNPAQQLDFSRFSSAEFLQCYRVERDAIRAHDPDRAVTTNLMLGNCRNLDYWSWAPEVDLVANDHYLVAESPDRHIDLSMAADLSRSLHAGRPWLLMEHSTSAVNWQPRNLAKAPGELRRNSLAHVARGSEGALFFQWRASRRGAEQFHSAMLPHGGTATRVWREVCELGRDMARLGPVRGSRVRTDVAIWWDWQSWWATALEFRPTAELDYRDQVFAAYAALWRNGRTVDAVGPASDLSGHRVLVVPSAFLLEEDVARRLQEWVERGGHLLVGPFSAVVDETEAVYPQGYLGPLREVLGVWVDEYHPVGAGVGIALDDGAAADLWSEAVVVDTAEVVARFTSGPDAGGPAVTRRVVGAGSAWYLATRLDDHALGSLLARVLDGAGVQRGSGLPAGVEVVARTNGSEEFLFVLNHTGEAVVVPVPGTDLLTGTTADLTTVAAGGVAVLATALQPNGHA